MIDLLQVTRVGTSINCLRQNIVQDSLYFLMSLGMIGFEANYFLKNVRIIKIDINVKIAKYVDLLKWVFIFSKRHVTRKRGEIHLGVRWMIFEINVPFTSG